jgi:hypothetical protein
MQQRATLALLLSLYSGDLFSQVTLQTASSPAVAIKGQLAEYAGDGDDGGSTAFESFLPVEKTPAARQFTWSGISNQKRVNWRGLFRDAGTLLAVEHAFRIATEPGTRKGLSGPFLKNYWRAVENLHGWADGDELYVNWVGHPMQGAVAGYIFVQNDIPAYRYSSFGKNRDYWKSRLRSLAFSYAYSVQFEIGLVSEASIGGIQSQSPQQGFVDHVVTPVFGVGWMIAEDALDKYLVRRLEDHVRNRYAVLLVRGFLNPARSFANVMKFEVPWHRDTRPDLFRPDPRGQTAQTLLEHSPISERTRSSDDRARAAAIVAPFEFDLAFQTNRYNGKTGAVCFGASGNAAIRVTSRWQAVTDVGGCKLAGLAGNWSGDSLHFLTGARWTPWASGNWSAHAQILAGGEKMTHEAMFPTVKTQMYDAWQRQGSDPVTKPNHDQYTKQYETSGPSVQAGAGLTYRINSALKLRVANVDYRHSWLGSLDRTDYTSSVIFSTGFTLRMGTW